MMEDVWKKFIFVYVMNRKKQIIIHTFNTSRLLKGAFYSLVKDLKADDVQPFNSLRMN